MKKINLYCDDQSDMVFYDIKSEKILGYSNGDFDDICDEFYCSNSGITKRAVMYSNDLIELGWFDPKSPFQSCEKDVNGFIIYANIYRKIVIVINIYKQNMYIFNLNEDGTITETGKYLNELITKGPYSNGNTMPDSIPFTQTEFKYYTVNGTPLSVTYNIWNRSAARGINLARFAIRSNNVTQKNIEDAGWNTDWFLRSLQYDVLDIKSNDLYTITEQLGWSTHHNEKQTFIYRARQGSLQIETLTFRYGTEQYENSEKVFEMDGYYSGFEGLDNISIDLYKSIQRKIKWDYIQKKQNNIETLKKRLTECGAEFIPLTHSYDVGNCECGTKNFLTDNAIPIHDKTLIRGVITGTIPFIITSDLIQSDRLDIMLKNSYFRAALVHYLESPKWLAYVNSDYENVITENLYEHSLHRPVIEFLYEIEREGLSMAYGDTEEEAIEKLNKTDLYRAEEIRELYYYNKHRGEE